MTQLSPKHRPAPRERIGRPKVAVVYTHPDTVLQDVSRAMHLAEYQSHLSHETPVLLKINISWQHWYPGCSTTPWQLDGVIHTLQDDGYANIIPAQNGTVVVDSYEGEVKNKHKAVLDSHDFRSVHLDVPPTRWVPYSPIREMMVLDKIFPEGISIPQLFYGKSIIQLPTMR